MSTMLVTGSRGFLGRSLCERVRAQGHKVLELDAEQGDVADKDALAPYNNEQIDHVFHLAAKTYVPDSWQRPYDFFRTNIMGTENVLELCKTSKASLTYVSAYLYGQPDALPIDENHPVRPNNPYAQSKHLAEQLCDFYANYYAVRTTVIRPFNIFGPGQSKNFLIPHIVEQALHKDVIKVKDLYPRRDYLYIDDLIDALMLSTKSAAAGCLKYNIGSGYSLSVKEIIDIIQEAIQTNKPVESEAIVRPNEISDVVADIARARERLHWFPRHTFREGILKLVQQEAEGAC
jgi:GDP-4-dehydro-6-deoxy-D-mannose reductase